MKNDNLIQYSKNICRAQERSGLKKGARKAARTQHSTFYEFSLRRGFVIQVVTICHPNRFTSRMFSCRMVLIGNFVEMSAHLNVCSSKCEEPYKDHPFRILIGTKLRTSLLRCHEFRFKSSRQMQNESCQNFFLIKFRIHFFDF